MIQSKTASGISVTLTGVETNNCPEVEVSLVHPQAGQMTFRSSTFGSPDKGKNKGIMGWHGANRVCATVPEADFKGAMAEAKALIEKEIADIKSGAKLIEVYWQQGEPLSGYAPATARSGKLLAGLGLAESVSGWGTLVDRDLVAALGTSFTYAQAVEFNRPRMEAHAAKFAAKDAKRQAIFDRARTTGQKVELSRGSDECDGSVDECSLDIVTEWAMPDGTTTTTRIHTH